MKLLLMSFFIVLITFDLEGQNYDNIIPIEERREQKKIKDGTYFKDANHLFEKYKGTWRGTLGAKKYKIVLKKKSKKVDYIAKIKEDLMLLRYKITENGNEIISTLSLPDDNGLVNPGNQLYDEGDHFDYYFVYSGKETKCGQSGDIPLRTTDDPNKLKLKLYPEGGFIIAEDCPHGEAEQVFPTDKWLILHKKD